MELITIGLILIFTYFISKYVMLDVSRPKLYDVLRALQIIGYILVLSGLASCITPYK